MNASKSFPGEVRSWRHWRPILELTSRPRKYVWSSRDGIEVNAYALKELKIGSECLASLTCGLHNLQRVQEIVRVTVKYWYDLLGPLKQSFEQVGNPRPSPEGRAQLQTGFSLSYLF